MRPNYSTLNILKHLDTEIKFHVSDTCFKPIISVFLPSLWHTYVEPYNGNANNPNDADPKWCLPSDTFIGLLQEEYKIQLTRSNNGTNKNNTNGSVDLVKIQNATSTSKFLADRLTDCKSSLQPYCDLCKHAGH